MIMKISFFWHFGSLVQEIYSYDQQYQQLKLEQLPHISPKAQNNTNLHIYDSFHCSMIFLTYTLMLIQWQISLSLQLINSQMIPFGQASEEIMASFFDKLYKLCRYKADFSEFQIDSLEKVQLDFTQLMRKKIMAPAQLFNRLTSETLAQKTSSNEVVKKENVNEENEGHGQDIGNLAIIFDDDMMEVEDDLNDNSNDEPQIFHFALKNMKSAYLNQTQHSFSSDLLAKQQSKKQVKQQSADQSQDSYEEYLNTANKAREMAHDYCKFHISGLFNEKKKKLKGKKPIQSVKNSILLIKDRQSPEEYLLPNCHSTMKIGEALEVYEHLKACQTKMKER